MSTQPELLACPFCGTQPRVSLHGALVACANDACIQVEAFDTDGEGARKSWNTRHSAPAQRTSQPCGGGQIVDDASLLLARMDVVQAYADASYIASVHAHHALWAGLLEFGWDEKTEKFGMALADRISKEIAAKAKKIGLAAAQCAPQPSGEPSPDDYCRRCGLKRSDHGYNNTSYGLCGKFVERISLPAAGGEASKREADLREAVAMARNRLERFADQANAGQVHYDARELKRKIWAAFADVDAISVLPEQRGSGGQRS